MLTHNSYLLWKEESTCVKTLETRLVFFPRSRFPVYTTTPASGNVLLRFRHLIKMNGKCWDMNLTECNGGKGVGPLMQFIQERKCVLCIFLEYHTCPENLSHLPSNKQHCPHNRKQHLKWLIHLKTAVVSLLQYELTQEKENRCSLQYVPTHTFPIKE